ncbi:MAG TPA: sarcosine oxidase subunit delta [Stellaceae bacterium]|nr:sarcosine oxidase subunit delta [Stellaceae bacterium]
MMLIECPWCGPRGHVEFTYAGDATIKRPAADAGEAAFADYVYLRDNRRGPHRELWHHTGGCRRFVEVQRNTLTHEIAATSAPGAGASRRDPSDRSTA